MRDLTQGSVTKHLLHLSSFMSVAVLLLTLYHLADIYWVGKLGKESIAAVGLAGNLFFVVLALGQTLSIGVSTLISHATGAKDQARARLIFNQGLVFSGLMGLAVIAVGVLILPFYFEGLGADEPTALVGKPYLAWVLPAFLLQLVGMTVGGALRGTGDVRTPMFINGGAVLLNVILDPILIFGWGPAPELGVTGAAIATLIAISIAAALLLLHFRRGQSYLRLDHACWWPRGDLFRRMFYIGGPAGAQNGLTSINLMLTYWVISPFGPAAQAGFAVGMRVTMSLMIPAAAMAFAAAAVAGQNFGAQRLDRVRQTFFSSALLATCLTLAAIAACQAGPAWFIRLFSHDPNVVAYGADYLRIIAWTFVLTGLIHTSSSIFQGLGKTLPMLATAAIRLVAFTVPVVLISRRTGFEIQQVWYLWVGAILLHLCLNLYLLGREFRQLRPTPSSATATRGATEYVPR